VLFVVLILSLLYFRLMCFFTSCKNRYQIHSITEFFNLFLFLFPLLLLPSRQHPQQYTDVYTAMEEEEEEEEEEDEQEEEEAEEKYSSNSTKWLCCRAYFFKPKCLARKGRRRCDGLS